MDVEELQRHGHETFIGFVIVLSSWHGQNNSYVRYAGNVANQGLRYLKSYQCLIQNLQQSSNGACNNCNSFKIVVIT